VFCKLAKTEQEKNGRKAQITALIVDSRNIQNADTVEEIGYPQTLYL